MSIDNKLIKTLIARVFPNIMMGIFALAFLTFNPVVGILGIVFMVLFNINASKSEKESATVQGEVESLRAKADFLSQYQAIPDAKAEAKIIIDDAKAEADRIIGDAEADSEELKTQAQVEADGILSESQRSLSEAKDTLEEAQEQVGNAMATKMRLESEITSLQSEYVEVSEKVTLQSFGLYEPQYEFENVVTYKVELDRIRQSQKAMIKNETAVTGASEWVVNRTVVHDAKIVNDMRKLLLRAFNSECDSLVSKVKFNNIEAYERRMESSCKTISKLGSIMSIRISEDYLKLKKKELHLAYEYQVKKQEEKEEQKRIRADMREQAKAQKELEEARKLLEKEQTHYETALEKVLSQLEAVSDPELKNALEDKREELEKQLIKLDADLEQVDYRVANQKAGYVYVISNVGAFGEGVYKIGMTRRLDPMERVYELGDASVPFAFDVHAMIFSEDAPKLEAALHHAFEEQKVNMVNTRREFFRVSLDEIKRVVQENYDKTVEFVDEAPAEQYRESLLLRKKSQAQV